MFSLLRLHAAIPQLTSASAFSVQDALKYVGWPSESIIPAELAAKVGAKAVAEGLLIPTGKTFLCLDRSRRTVEDREREV